MRAGWIGLGLVGVLSGCGLGSKNGGDDTQSADTTGDDTGPGGDDTSPTGDDTGPGGDDTSPTGDDTGPGGDDTSPTGDDTGPGGDDTSPTGDDTAPALGTADTHTTGLGDTSLGDATADTADSAAGADDSATSDHTSTPPTSGTGWVPPEPTWGTGWEEPEPTWGTGWVEPEPTWGTGNVSPTGDTGAVPVPCTITPITPLDGATDVFVDATLVARVQGGDTSAPLVALSASGRALGVTVLSEPGGVLRILPAQTMSANTGHAVEIDGVCDDGTAAVWSFTTGAAAAPTVAGGRGDVLETSSFELVDPPGLTSTLAALLAGYDAQPLLWVGDGPSADTRQVGLGAVGQAVPPYAQDACAPTVVVQEDGAFAGGVLTASADALTVTTSDATAQIEDVVVTAVAAPSGGGWATVDVAARIDFRDNPDYLDLLGAGSASDVCTLLSSFGVGCVPCDDGTPVCLDALVRWTDPLPLPGAVFIAEVADTAVDTATCPNGQGCSCTTGGAPGAWWWLGVPVLGILRRRR